MAEDLKLISGTKHEQYENLLLQTNALLAHESDLTANMANFCAALKQQFDWLWVGFYIVRGDELVLGPFQGPIACTRIKKGKGVCGSCWDQAKPVIVHDVEQFPGHIACSSLSKSEVVLPLIRNGQVIAVLDIDSERLGSFDETDVVFLEKMLEAFSVPESYG
jgi:L-methionine (R)-S-oxide reductase